MPKDKKDKVVTSGTEWRRAREKGELVELPSGKVARLRPISLLSLMKRGRIPDPLSAVISEMIGGKTKKGIDLETFQGFAELLELVCREAFVEPKIVDEPGADDEIGAMDVGFDDQLFVFNHAQGEIQLMRPFRSERAGDVEAAHGSEDVPVEAQPDGGDRGDVGGVLSG